MQYIVIIMIILFLLGLLKAALESVFDFIKQHKYPVGSAVAILLCWHNGGLPSAIWAAVLCLIIWIIIVRIHVTRIRLQKAHLEQFNKWLERNATQLGQTSVQAMLQNTVPERFIRCSYPEGNSKAIIVENFIKNCQISLNSHMKESLYEEVCRSGMIDEQEVQKVLSRQYEKATRYRSLMDAYAEAVAALEAEHKLDRPTDDKKILHCVGASSGSQFDSEELNIEI